MPRRRQQQYSESQPTLFDLIKEVSQVKTESAPASFNISYRLRSEISEGLKQCPLSRFEVAARMSNLLGIEVTKSQLDSWTAESKDHHRFPAEYLPAYCAVTGYKEPLRMIARLVQCYVLESEEALLAELGRIDQSKRELTRKERTIRDFLENIKS
ncbi:MAG TPA: hypothetical protein VN426_06295 [Syntrophomonadaceae bacterium]|nr:hypothetical protein [Syntrophomonadaceae bacterium]